MPAFKKRYLWLKCRAPAVFTADCMQSIYLVCPTERLADWRGCGVGVGFLCSFLSLSLSCKLERLARQRGQRDTAVYPDVDGFTYNRYTHIIFHSYERLHCKQRHEIVFTCLTLLKILNMWKTHRTLISNLPVYKLEGVLCYIYIDVKNKRTIIMTKK